MIGTAARNRSGTPTGAGRPLVVTLSVVVLSVAFLQTVIVPVLGAIAVQLREPAVSVSWVVTANLLAAAAATPLIGRLADLRSKKRVLLCILALILGGSLLAATTASLPLLLLGRILQGSAFALYPVAVSILRDEIRPERLARSITALSAMLGLGGVLGLAVTAVLMTDGARYQRVFWLCTLFSAAVIVAVWRVVPDRPRYGRADIDWLGGIGLAVGLAAVLLAITQGSRWGWMSPATLAAAALGMIALGFWWFWSRRCANPLVSISMLSRRPVLLANLATLLVGMGLYFWFLGTVGFVEAPVSSGYGFGAGVRSASMEFVLPGFLAGVVVALVAGRYIERFGPRVVFAAGASAGALGFASLLLWHSDPWQVVLAGLLINAYISLSYAALPIMVIAEVGDGETGIATSLNAIFRLVGSAIGAALFGALESPGAGGRIPESAFDVVFNLGAATAVMACLLAVRRRR